MSPHKLANVTIVSPLFLNWQGDGIEQNETEAIKLIHLSAEQVFLSIYSS